MEGCPLGVRKGAWTEQEDVLLKNFIQKYGEGKWHQVPSKAGLNRCRKSCRLRWLNYLRPNIKRGEFAFDEVDLIIRLHKLLGNRWSLIAGRLPGRTANDVKNYWNTSLRKKMVSHQNELLLKNKNQETPVEFKIIKPQPRTFSKNNLLRLRANVMHENSVQLQENPSKLSQTPPPPLPQLMVQLLPQENGEIDPWWESLLVENNGGDDKTATSSISWPEDEPIIAREYLARDHQPVPAVDQGTNVGGLGDDCDIEGHSGSWNFESNFGVDIWNLLDLEN